MSADLRRFLHSTPKVGDLDTTSSLFSLFFLYSMKHYAIITTRKKVHSKGKASFQSNILGGVNLAKGDKYQPLHALLSRQSAEITLSFEDIEHILGFKLPNSAYTYEVWWSNDSNHSQAISWLKCNMRSENLNLRTKHVTFTKNAPTTKSHTSEKVVVPPSNIPNPPSPLPTNYETIFLGNYLFSKTSISIIKTNIPDVFLRYKGVTVGKLLDKKHYCNLRSVVNARYRQYLAEDISVFMQDLVDQNDPFYHRFLNTNGADFFCEFKLSDPAVHHLKGLYAYCLDGTLKYIGRCRDSFHSRFNVNYGVIQPINCYKAGQSTNTHMNSLINVYRERISIYICPLTNDSEIITAEQALIDVYQPDWNRKK